QSAVRPRKWCGNARRCGLVVAIVCDLTAIHLPFSSDKECTNFPIRELLEERIFPIYDKNADPDTKLGQLDSSKMSHRRLTIQFLASNIRHATNITYSQQGP